MAIARVRLGSACRYPAVRLGRKFIRPTYGDDQEPGEPEAVVPDDDGKVRSARPEDGAGAGRCVRSGAAAAGVGVAAAGAGDSATVAVIDASHDAAVADTLAWLEDEAVVVYSGPGGIRWARSVGGLVVARFRHHDSRHRMSLLHDHLVVSVKVLRADGMWGHLDSRRLLAHVVAAGALYNQRVLEEVCGRLGLATEPRTRTPGLRSVMEIAGGAAGVVRLDGYPTARHRRPAGAGGGGVHGRSRLPAPRVRAADDSRPAKKTPLPLTDWRAAAGRAA